MKTRLFSNLLFPFIFAVVFGLISFSCATAEQKTLTTHERIIGTKWASVTNPTDTVEFLDSENCYIVMGNSMRSGNMVANVPYTVDATKIIVGNGLIWYELRGNTLYRWGSSAHNKI